MNAHAPIYLVPGIRGSAVPAAALGAVRLSLGRSTTREQIDRAAESLARAWRSVRQAG
jgi:cysteine sulfinate desulfinase/cysteine desulfurase-like protein